MAEVTKTRKPPRPVGKPRKRGELNLFHGYPAELIAEWCCVALLIAHMYKTGLLNRSKAAEKLLRLRRNRLVQTPKWRGWLRHS